MNKRRASRELGLITFSQLSKTLSNSEEVDILLIIEKSVKILTGEAINSLNHAVGELLKIKEFIQNYEIEHPENLDRPYEISTIPVKIPMTSDMTGRIESIISSAEKIYDAVDMVELSSMQNLAEVRDYSVKIVKTFIDNKDEIDELIKKHSRGWDLQRLVKIDRDVLRIAITEILFFDDVPYSVSVDEAVELAKKYSTDESSSFINGILGQIILSLKPASI
jgi:N utilization substance protein B